jgi:hypothetical protein
MAVRLRVGCSGQMLTPSLRSQKDNGVPCARLLRTCGTRVAALFASVAVAHIPIAAAGSTRLVASAFAGIVVVPPVSVDHIPEPRMVVVLVLVPRILACSVGSAGSSSRTWLRGHSFRSVRMWPKSVELDFVDQSSGSLLAVAVGLRMAVALEVGSSSAAFVHVALVVAAVVLAG